MIAAISAVMLLSAGAVPTRSLAIADEDDCLHGQAEPVAGNITCTEPDTRQIAGREFVREVIAGLGIGEARIVFGGCSSGPFGTSILRNGDTVVFKITYPSTSNIADAEYVGPITHELGHVFQLQGFSSIHQYRVASGLPGVRIELAADFLAGLAFRRAMPEVSRGAFQFSIHLLGSYNRGLEDSHATPEARTAAFRLGYYFKLGSMTLRDAERAFQGDEFDQVMRENL